MLMRSGGLSQWGIAVEGKLAAFGIVLIALLIVSIPTPAAALHWQVDVFIGPTIVPMESVQTFTIRLRNNGPNPVAVHLVQVTFDWVAQGYAYTVTDQLFNLAPANDRSFTLNVEIPRLVQDSVHTMTTFVTAETSGDLFEEQKQYNGQITVTAPVAAAGSLLLVGVGALVAIVIVVVVVIYALTRRKVPRPFPVSPMTTPAQTASNCPTCGRPLTFVSQYQRWYCPAENRYV